MTKKHFIKMGLLAVAASAAVAACRSDNGSSGSGGSGGSGATGGSGYGGSSGSGTGGSGTGGSAGMGTGGSGGSGTGGSAGAAAGGSAGQGSGGSAGASCGGQLTTVQHLNDGTVGASVNVELQDVVATSQKFLVSASKSSGSCLWAVFVSAPGIATAAEGTGMELYGYGDKAVTTDGGVGPCPTGTDAIPDDVKPGDTLHVYGKTTLYAPTCSAPIPVKSVEVQVYQKCPITKTGTAAVPAPYVMDAATATAIGTQTDATTINKWANVLVKVNNLTAEAADGGGAVGAYGNIKFTTPAIEGHDKIFFSDLSGAGPKASGKGWVYGTTTSFNSMTGIIYLDYCTWSLNPRDKCTDVDPKSDDCP